MADKRTTIMLTDEDRKLIAAARKKLGKLSVIAVIRVALRHFAGRNV